MLRNVFKHNPTQSPGKEGPNDSTFPISILCKNLLYFKFYIQKEVDQIDVFETLRRLMNISEKNLFPLPSLNSFALSSLKSIE